MRAEWKAYYAALPHPPIALAHALCTSALPDTLEHAVASAQIAHERSIAQDANPATALAMIDRALDRPDQDIRIRLFLLRLALDHAFTPAFARSAPGVIAQVRELATPELPAHFRLIAPRFELRLARQRRRSRDMDRALADGEPAVADDPGCDAALEWRVQHLLADIDRHRLSSAGPLLDELLGERQRIAERIGIDLQQFRWRLATLRRDADACTALLAEPDWPASPEQHIDLAVMRGQADEVERLISQGSFTPEFRYFQRARVCLRLRRVGLFAEMVEALRLRAKAPLAREFAERLTVRLALLQRRPAEAAYLLQQLDPDEDFGDLHSEWLRCRRLQGDLGAAARHWHALLQRGPAYVQGMLAEAAELDPADIGLIAASAPTVALPAGPRAAGRTPRQATSDEVPQLVGPGPAMSEARELLRTLAPRPEPLLISGETGCGKEIAARMVHRLGSGPSSPFVAINCGALAESLAEAELFGYVRGAFTGAERGRDGAIAQAAGGVLFLDEISAMPLRLQSLLLRVLESGDYRPLGSGQPRQLGARIISAANEDLASLAAQGRFRHDLLYRLQRLTVRLPPLRERREDIAPLARHFMRQTGLQRLPELSPDLLELWRRHDWPGNVRELRNEVESLMVLHGHLPMFSPAQSPLARRGTSVRLSRVQSEVVLPPEALDSGSSAPKPGPARQPAPLPAKPGCALADRLPVDGPAPPGGRKVLERRRAILSLIDEHGRITRSLVIAKLACAPNTATADLQALEEDGLVRRIVLGNNLRLSYFVAADQSGKSA